MSEFTREDELRGQIFSGGEVIKEVEETIYKDKQELAVLVCPYKIGDELESRKHKRAIVSRVSIGSSGVQEYTLWGYLILKSGKPSDTERQLYRHQMWILLL